jgi:anti-sigma factor RsiW
MDCLSCGRLLSAHFDRELDEADETRVLHHLRHCDACSRTLAGLQALRCGLHELALPTPDLTGLAQRVCAAVAAETSPPMRALGPMTAPEPTQRRPVRRRHGLLPALGTGALCAVSAAWLTAAWLHSSPEEELGNVAVSAYLRSTRLAAGDGLDSGDAQQVARWLQRRLKRAVAVPDLQGQGYRLVGTRIDFLYRQEVVALVYQSGAHLIEVYLWPRGDERPMQAKLSEDGLRVRFWSHRGEHRCAISDLDDAALSRFVADFDA